jgi:hypothetical protein
MEINPYQLDWGEVFVDSYNVETKSATLVYNFDFGSFSLFNECVSYSIGHIYWVMLNLPEGSRISAIFDLQGIDISEQVTNKINREITEHLQQHTDVSLLKIIFKR